MLRDKVSCARMKTSSKERGHDEVCDRAPSASEEQHIVESELEGDVLEVPSREGLGLDETGTEGVEEDLERAEGEIRGGPCRVLGTFTRRRPCRRRFGGSCVRERSGGQCRCRPLLDVCGARCGISELPPIQHTGLSCRMRSHLERHGVRDANGEVGDHGKILVGFDALECEVMGDLVDGQEEVLVGRSSDGVGREDEHRGPEGGVPKPVSGAQLDANDQKHDVFRERFIAHEFDDLERI